MMLGPWLCSTLTHSFRGTTFRNPSSIKAYPKFYPNFQRLEDCNPKAVLSALSLHYPYLYSIQSVHHLSIRVECWGPSLYTSERGPEKKLITHYTSVFNENLLSYFVILCLFVDIWIVVYVTWFTESGDTSCPASIDIRVCQPGHGPFYLTQCAAYSWRVYQRGICQSHSAWPYACIQATGACSGIVNYCTCRYLASFLSCNITTKLASCSSAIKALGSIWKVSCAFQVASPIVLNSMVLL